MAYIRRQETPVERWARELRDEFDGAIVLMRVGALYRTFPPDASAVSAVAGIPCRSGECHVPTSDIQGILEKLVERGHKVLLCDEPDAVQLGQSA